MKKNTIFVALLVFILIALIFLLQFPFFHNRKNWFVDKSNIYIASCKTVKIGASQGEIIEVMGKPDSNFVNDNKITLIYFTGGVKTEQGISFELVNDLLIRKNCIGTWEPPKQELDTFKIKL